MRHCFRSRFSKRRFVIATVALLALVVFVFSRMDLHRITQALTTASPGYLVFALALMGFSLLLRAFSWREILRAALPKTLARYAPVARATMIGVMASAIFPGRVGEPSRILILARRLEGDVRSLVPIIAGTVFSQTLINLLALAVLGGVTFTSVPLLRGNIGTAVATL